MSWSRGGHCRGRGRGCWLAAWFSFLFDGWTLAILLAGQLHRVGVGAWGRADPSLASTGVAGAAASSLPRLAALLHPVLGSPPANTQHYLYLLRSDHQPLSPLLDPELVAVLVLGQHVLEGDRCWVHTAQPLAFQRLPGVNPLAWVQGQHSVQEFHGGGRHQQAELLPHPPPVLLLRLELLEAGQVDNLRPVGWTGSPAQTANHHQLGELLVGLRTERERDYYSTRTQPQPSTDLEEGFLGEEFPQDTAAAPDINGRSVSLLSQQKFRRSVPQCDHFVGVRPLFILGIVQPDSRTVSIFTPAKHSRNFTLPDRSQLA